MVAQNRGQPGRGGAIINMSSVNAIMAIPSIAGYNASKGGVNNLTRCALAPCCAASPPAPCCMPQKAA
jgi:NAD(P)-dependent dehydrogenase (short-subunit alcohol dehydrogenase family)